MIISLIIVIVCCTWILFSSKNNSSKNLTAEININGKIVETIKLNKDKEYLNVENIKGLNIKVENSKIAIVDSSCKDRICVHQGFKGNDGDCIVCLPNKVIVKIKGDK